MIALVGLALGLLSVSVLAAHADVGQYTLAWDGPGRTPPAFQAPPLYAPLGPNRRPERYPPPPIDENTLLPPTPRYGSPGGFMPPPLPYAYERPLND